MDPVTESPAILYTDEYLGMAPVSEYSSPPQHVNDTMICAPPPPPPNSRCPPSSAHCAPQAGVLSRAGGAQD